MTELTTLTPTPTPPDARAHHLALLPTLRRVDQEDSGDGWVYPGGTVAAAFLSPVVAGQEPFTAEFTVSQEFDRFSILPEGATIVRGNCEGTEEKKIHLYARCDRGGVYVSPNMVAASATDLATAQELVAEMAARIPAVDTDDGRVGIRLWSQGSHGTHFQTRSIEAPLWDEVRANYPGAVGEQLDALMARERPPTSEASGKLVVWYGPPGTGKTTAIRALMRRWRGWCAPQYLPDPERFFASADYMAEVLSGSVGDCDGWDDGHDGPRPQKYRLVIAEDCDEFISSSARFRAGAALGRLLNLSDGILGQGSNVIILLTTNEELRALHPALTRPGRCLAKVEFARFTVEQAKAWLGDPRAQVPGSAPTLAELFEAKNGTPRIGHVPEAPLLAGLYI